MARKKLMKIIISVHLWRRLEQLMDLVIIFIKMIKGKIARWKYVSI